MKNRIVDINGKPIQGQPKPPEPRNLPELIEEARRLYEKRDERKAFHKLCDAMLMCGQGVARNMNDAQLLLQEVKALRENLVTLGEQMVVLEGKVTPK